MMANAENWIGILDASRDGDIDRVRALLDAGAEPDSPDILSGYTPLHNAVCAGNVALVELLLDSGADIEHSKNTVYATPLTTAVLSHRPEMVRLLLSRGADASVKVYPDARPLPAVAREEANAEIADLLESHDPPTRRGG